MAAIWTAERGASAWSELLTLTLEFPSSRLRRLGLPTSGARVPVRRSGGKAGVGGRGGGAVEDGGATVRKEHQTSGEVSLERDTMFFCDHKHGWVADEGSGGGEEGQDGELRVKREHQALGEAPLERLSYEGTRMPPPVWSKQRHVIA